VDPEWFDYFHTGKLWHAADVPQILANWCARNLTDRRRLEVAISWHDKLGPIFTDVHYERLAFLLRKVPQPWAQAWKTLSRMPRKRQDVIMHHFRLAQALEGALHDDHDLQNAVKAITPQVELKTRWWTQSDDTEQVPQTLRDIVAVSLSLDDPSDMDRLVTAILHVQGKEHRLAQLCNEALFDVGTEASELGIVNSEWDALDISVPTVEAQPISRRMCSSVRRTLGIDRKTDAK
jgi:hypothetical protein